MEKMSEDIKDLYKKEKNTIRLRLKEFRKLSPDKWKEEFFFCLLTPQSSGQRCWSAVEELRTLGTLTQEQTEQIKNVLRSRTRFHNTKANRLIIAEQNWPKIKEMLQGSKIPTTELRDLLAKEVNGFGLKEASHFLRNIGRSNNDIAILDRHILKNLFEAERIPEPAIKTRKQYHSIEQVFLNYARELGIPADELDLLLWRKENGEVFK